MPRLLPIHVLPGALCLTLVVPVLAEQTVFKNVLGIIQTSPADRRLRYKDVDVVFDDGARRMIVKSKDRPLDVAYEDIAQVIFEASTAFRGGTWIFGVPTGIGRDVLQTYWCYIEYRAPDGKVEPYLLEIDEDHSSDVLRQMQTLFGERVRVVTFSENASVRDLEKDLLPDIGSKHDMEADKDNRPLPDTLDDQALIVVVTPALRGAPHGKGRQVKIHVNDRVVAVNKYATYGWFYLNPGEYQLVSQAANARAIEIAVEAGMAYYFLQYASYGDLRTYTTLTRHTKELVMYQLHGAFHSMWIRKD